MKFLWRPWKLIVFLAHALVVFQFFALLLKKSKEKNGYCLSVLQVVFVTIFEITGGFRKHF
jgi:hypothetical protein